jgi:hypothetical protein
MRRGKIAAEQRHQYVVAIEDVNLYGDGVLYTIWILSEGVSEKEDKTKISSQAKLINVTAQKPPMARKSVRIPKRLIKKAVERFPKTKK